MVGNGDNSFSVNTILVGKMSGKPNLKKKNTFDRRKNSHFAKKKLARDKGKADARRIKRNPLNLQFFSRYGDFKEEKNKKLAIKAVNKVSKMKGLFNKNPVEESETDLPPHHGNEIEQQHSSTPANDIMSKDSCASKVLLSCLASEPKLEPQSETDASLLTKRLLTALYRERFYSKRLDLFLKARSMTEAEDLPKLQKLLEDETPRYLSHNGKATCHLSDLQ
ncbi:uncharacterized protein LOC124208658 [Daphnia pulex]|uniref:uncharacterized protein LOC124208658 n=1 Tax=Daphnia pulex TaxID=6669 RepID=UPI001EE01345|nr:uncharacterized protein LOC124208658 [Daphnia pulex]